MLDKARYIVVEGPIGAGKSSLARRLAERLPADDVLFEQPAANPFLGRFYQNMERWALPTQISFLFQRIDQLAEFAAGNPNRRIVSDFILQKDPLFAALNLPADELALYQRVFDNMMPPTLPRPDLVIYLQARPDTLMERIRRRGMDAERHITEHYVQRVAERFARFFYQYDAAPLFIVDAEVLNPVDHDDDFELLLDRLRHMRSYREFFAYAG
ncbi:deoxynucleoside kinase [Pseudothauera nasutitermitis]|uniref:Deoxynucleoside kinase n=1 Tax=Pseudothauera nasutitermitis TaxID=2565930 RepID=A0A4V3WB45_9RHOO|nr:deoxynucleoside kinase [Pseudothauera nasutitermitis]THF61485.1 deoxynucleoside kinase [Pseudothauera nasutitermitis]